MRGDICKCHPKFCCIRCAVPKSNCWPFVVYSSSLVFDVPFNVYRKLLPVCLPFFWKSNAYHQISRGPKLWILIVLYIYIFLKDRKKIYIIYRSYNFKILANHLPFLNIKWQWCILQDTTNKHLFSLSVTLVTPICIQYILLIFDVKQVKNVIQICWTRLEKCKGQVITCMS